MDNSDKNNIDKDIVKEQEPEIESGEALDGALNNPSAPSSIDKQVSKSNGIGVPDGDGGSIERENGIV